MISQFKNAVDISRQSIFYLELFPRQQCEGPIRHGRLTLTAPMTNCVIFFLDFWKKIRLDIPCESSTSR